MRPYLHTRPNIDNPTHNLLFTAIGLIFWAAVIFGLIMLISWFVRKQADTHQHTHDPLDIARLRYAKGELTKEEFSQLKKDLSEKA